MFQICHVRYIHAKDVADGLLFILSLPRDYKHEGDFGGARCPKFNLVLYPYIYLTI